MEYVALFAIGLIAGIQIAGIAYNIELDRIRTEKHHWEMECKEAQAMLKYKQEQLDKWYHQKKEELDDKIN